MYLTWRTLGLRQQCPDLFKQGEYLPLGVKGAKADHVIAFVRKDRSTSLLVVAPRLVGSLLGDIDLPPIGARVWEDTQIKIPPGYSHNYRNLLTGKILHMAEEMNISDVLAEFPVALCMRE